MNNFIQFDRIEVTNFFSIGDTVELSFDSYSGMNYVFGYNKDLNLKNGSGKCVAPETIVEVGFDDPETMAKFEEFLKKKDS